MTITSELLEILACPQCKGVIRFQEQENEIVCDRCAIAYPIRDEIPVMLIDEARPVGDDRS